MPTLANVEEFVKTTAEKIIFYTETQTGYKEQFEHHLEIIRRYDEVLCEKASK